jgi:hypothetical protein
MPECRRTWGSEIDSVKTMVSSNRVVLGAWIVVTLLACGGVGTTLASTNALELLYGVLEAQGIPVERSTADAAAVGAALASVDARATLIETGAAPVMPTNGPGLRVEFWEQKIGYLGVSSLSVTTASNIVQQVVDWEVGEGVGILLDLRGSGGDDLAAVDSVVGLVAANGTHLYHTKDHAGEILESHVALGSACCRIPLVALIDPQTRDAAEVLAAVLKKQGGAMLVGQATLGDASVRRPVPLSDQLSAVIAYGKVCLGEACDYDGVGVEPDVLVDTDAMVPAIDMSSNKGPNGRLLTDKALRDRALMKRIEKDLVMRRAADILLGLKALGEFDVEPSVDTPEVSEDVLPEDK